MNPDDLIAEIEAGPRGPHIGAFFDLDGTLVHGFTATHVLKDKIRGGQVGAGELGRLVLTALDGALGGNPTRAGDLGISALRGHAMEQLEELGERLFLQKIAGTIRPQARAIVKAHQRMGHTVALASAATRFQTGPVARSLGIDDIVCTELETEDGVLTGRVIGAFLWGEHKARAVRDFARERGIDLPESYGYANGDEDIAFLASTGRPHAIGPGRALRQAADLQDWPILDMHEPLRVGLRAAVATAGAVAGLNAGLLGGAVVGVVRRDRRAGINLGIATACDAALTIAGVRLEVTGAEHLQERPAIFIGNHQSSLDPVIMGALLRGDIAGVAKAEARRDPRMLLATLLLDPVFIDRSNSTQSRAALDALQDRVRSGTSIMIFPEGTRMPTPEPGPFKKGAFHMAMQVGVPIVPVVFRNAGALLAPHSLVVRPGTVEVCVLEPIDTSDWTVEGLNDIVSDVRQKFVDTLEKWPA